MEATLTEDQQTPTRVENTPKLYSSISDLPFEEYINAVINQDTSKIADWAIIQQEFSDAINSPQTGNISQIAEIEGLNKTYELILLFVAILQVQDIPEIREQLEILNFPLHEDDFDGLLARAASLQMEIDEKKEAIGLDKEKPESEKPTRQMFTDIVARLSRHFKLSLRIKELMTDEFCAHYKAFVEEISKAAPSMAAEEV